MDNSSQSAVKIDEQRIILRKYYLENDFFFSADGILKALSVIVSTLLSILFVWGGWCGARGATGAAAGALLGAGALLAALGVVVALCGARAPMACFICDIIVSTVIGVSLLFVAIFSLTLCENQWPIDYIYAPLALINSILVISSAVVTYTSVSKKWDKASNVNNNSNVTEPDCKDLEV